METSAIDKEMYDYFMQLNEAEKKSVVQMIKTFLQSRKEFERISIERYNKELKKQKQKLKEVNLIYIFRVRHTSRELKQY